VLAPSTFSAGWIARQPEGFVETRTAQIAMLPLSFFEGVAGLMRALDTLDLADELPRITAPTLVIGAALDRVFPVEHSQAIASAIAGARLEIIEGAGHAAVMETPETFARLVTEFVGGIDA
jgi:pimeloyl-ACP methyl ester carboxylesterase